MYLTLISHALFFSVMLFNPSVLHAEKKENPTWSINFNNIAISEALDQLSRFTRVKIKANKPIEDRITKSYRNKTIDYILRDMLKNLNYASAWSHGEEGVNAINIWVYEKSAEGDAGEMLVPKIPSITEQEASSRAVRPRVFPQRRAIQVGQPSDDTVQQDPEDDKSIEPEDSNTSQEEEQEQESTGTEKESDDSSKADEKSDAAEDDGRDKSSETSSEEKEESKESEENEGTDSQSSDSPSEESENSQ